MMERESVGHCIGSFGLGGCKGVGVDVQGGAGLAVPQGSGHRAHVCSAADKQRSVQMPERVDPEIRQAHPLTKPLHLFGRGAG